MIHSFMALLPPKLSRRPKSERIRAHPANATRLSRLMTGNALRTETVRSPRAAGRPGPQKFTRRRTLRYARWYQPAMSRLASAKAHHDGADGRPRLRLRPGRPSLFSRGSGPGRFQDEIGQVGCKIVDVFALDVLVTLEDTG